MSVKEITLKEITAVSVRSSRDMNLLCTLTAVVAGKNLIYKTIEFYIHS